MFSPTQTISLLRMPWCSRIILASVLLFGSPGWAQELRPYDGNTSYWQYKGNPVLLVGTFPGSHNVFLAPDQSNTLAQNQVPGQLETFMDDMVNNGGNVLRVVFDPGRAILWGFPAPFVNLNPGGSPVYDLNQVTDPADSNSFWGKFKTLLDEANQRDIIVQIEIWDRFDWFDQPGKESWFNSPFNPINNSNYTEIETDLAETYSSHTQNPFAHSVPAHPAYVPKYDVFRVYQEIYIRHMVSIALDYDNVIYTMNNETEEDPAWGQYWMDVIQQEAGAHQPPKTVFVTDMFDDGVAIQSSANYAQVLANPNDYTFVDISQNNTMKTSSGPEGHWDSLKYVHEQMQLSGGIRPINNTKMYGANLFVPNAGHLAFYNRNGDLAGQNNFWMNVIGGSASARFHRPTAGLGPSALATGSCDAVRKLETKIQMWEVVPDFNHTLLNNRDTFLQPASELLPYTFARHGDPNHPGAFVYGEAYLAAQPGLQYALYFTKGQWRLPDATLVDASVDLDLTSYAGVEFDLNWINVDTGNWGPSTTISGGSWVSIDAPSPNEPWVAAIVRTYGSTCIVAPDPDLNNDTLVNIFDLSVVGTCFGQDPTAMAQCVGADTQCDRLVNIFDLSFVGSSFGQSGF